MIQTVNFDGKDILGFRIEDGIDENDVNNLITNLDQSLKKDGKFNLYLEIPNIESVNFQALWEVIRYFIENLEEYLFQVDKMAIITDKNWLKTASEIENKLLIGIFQKVYPFSEADKAVDWLSE